MCVLLWAFVGFFADQCVVFTKKKTPKQTLFKNHCVGGGSGGGEGGKWRGGMGADIEGPKNNTAMSKLLPQANYPFGNSSDTSS